MARIGQAEAGRASAMLGLGVYRPERVVTNEEVCEVLDSSDEWIRTRSGIRTRRHAGDDETLVEMATRAARSALEVAGVEAGSVGAVIVATSTHAQHTPAAAPLVADRLGSRAAAFDIGAGCAGFCHALSVASDLVRGGTAEHVLVVGVERLSSFLDPTDRSTAFIFADGAGAVVVGAAEEPGIGPVAWGSDGSQSHVIRQSRSCQDVAPPPRSGEEGSDDSGDADGGHAGLVVQMEGTAVFRWAPFAMADVAREAVARAGLELGDLDAFVPHQANLRITETLARNLALPEGIVVARDVVDSGNTSAASVPLALDALLRSGEVSPGDTALLIAFGAGLSYAGQVVAVPPGATGA